MNRFESRRAVVGVLTVALVGSCATPPAPGFSPGDVSQVCRFSVEEKFGRPTFSAPVRTLAGAGAGAYVGLVFVGPQLILVPFLLPAFVALGAAAGAACDAAAMAHPKASADFERILLEADSGVLKRTLEAKLNAPRAECEQAMGDRSSAMPEAVIEIRKVESIMGCLTGNQKYSVVVQWQVLSPTPGSERTSGTTICSQTSSRSVEDWFAKPDRAKAEIERVLSGTGERIAMELFAKEAWRPCAFSPGDESQPDAK